MGPVLACRILVVDVATGGGAPGLLGGPRWITLRTVAGKGQNAVNISSGTSPSMDTVTDFALPPRLIPASQPHPGGRTAMWRSEPRTSPSCSQGTETRSVATSSLNFNIKRGFCRVVGLVKTGLMLSFQAMAANIRLIRQWSRRTSDVTDPLSELIAEHFGFEELDEHGQIALAEPFDFDDPPDELAA